ncbi:MAG TPA: diacylglycerol kinase family protein [Daejeonella sp.]|nr:diacylglycerol kinase family protein [Daejeonella sp.]
MAKVKLLHNAKAGDEEHSHHDLISLVESKGFQCDYASVKEGGWDEISDDTDFIVVAGGDGTVRKVIDKMLNRKVIDKKFPLAILPLGTANNLAKTLQVDVTAEEAVESWLLARKRPFDVGKIYGISGKKFFIEGLGYGIFPYLINRMQSSRLVTETPDQELEFALEELRNIALSYQTCYCKLEIDGADYSGDYLMVEVMNIRSIGPNLILGPDVKVDDGEFDIVLATEQHRQALVDYISNKLLGKEEKPELEIIKGRNITMEWQGSHCHVDDESIKIKKPEEIRIEVQKGLLEFLV